MMKISNTGPLKPADKAKKKEATGKAGGFSSHLAKTTSAGSHAPVDFTEINSVASMDNMLSIQEVGDSTDEEAKRVLYRHGEDILDRLSEIQREILSGGISKERLQNLAQMLRNRRKNMDDVELGQIIDEIELRAEVEIAKWTRSR
jgi:hypothetical protein